MQINNAAPQSRRIKVVADNQLRLEPILDSGGDRYEDVADPTPDDGYWNHNNQGNQADEYSILRQILTYFFFGYVALQQVNYIGQHSYFLLCTNIQDFSDCSFSTSLWIDSKI